MNPLDITFEQSPWELLLQKQPRDSVLSAVRLLTVLEGEDETAVDDAFAMLEDRHIALDISELPPDEGTSHTQARLQREQQLVKQGNYLQELEENDPLRLYLEELAAIPAAGDPQMLAQCYAGGQTEIMEQLVAVSISQAVAQAENMTGRGVFLLDLIQEASLGLWQAVLHYTGGDFESHAQWWICQYLARAVTMQAREKGVGNKMRLAMEQYRKADNLLLTRLGRNPTREEIAQEIGITPEAAEIYEDMLRTAQLLERATTPRADDPVEEEQAVEDTAYFQSRQRIADMLSNLDPVEAQVLTLRFGLEGGLPCTPQETAAKLNITAQQVIQTEEAALKKLRADT